MPSDRTASGAARRRGCLRTLITNQLRLWDRLVDDLEPWRQQGPLRWQGGRLDGAELEPGPRARESDGTDASPSAPGAGSP